MAWKRRFINLTYFVLFLNIYFISMMIFATTTKKHTRDIYLQTLHINETSSQSQATNEDFINVQTAPTEKAISMEMKYILLWTKRIHLRTGQDAFIQKQCRNVNCFITQNRDYLKDQTNFNAIIFNGDDLKFMKRLDLPKRRSAKQNFIFWSTVPASRVPITKPYYDNFFNWTWTYKLNSDFISKSFTIYYNGTVFGPAEEMNWPVFNLVDSDLKDKLKRKTKAAAWFPSQCKPSRRREIFINELNQELQKQKLSIDVCGVCGDEKILSHHKCLRKLENKYYFYLAFENSIDEDYVTKEVLIALNNYAVPIVYGGANYSRFLPPHSYLNAKELGPKVLAQAINQIIVNKTMYYEFFKWRNHLKYERNNNFEGICDICSELHEDKVIKKPTTYEHFREWWNGERQTLYDLLITFFKYNEEFKIAFKPYMDIYDKTNETMKTLLDNIRNYVIDDDDDGAFDIPTYRYNFSVTDAVFTMY